ncbi:MAG: hypothetical protein IPG50_30950 [Myxococcales bacterium]|nr:hypothetical protein [Myxococcales bacterium]
MSETVRAHLVGDHFLFIGREPEEEQATVIGEARGCQGDKEILMPRAKR